MTLTYLSGAPIAAPDLDDRSLAVAGSSPAVLDAHRHDQIGELMGEITRSPLWTAIVDPATPMEQVQEILRDIFLEIENRRTDTTLT